MLTRKRSGGSTPVRHLAIMAAALVAATSVALVACAGGETVVTVEVPVTTAPEVVVQTVVVERPVEVPGENVSIVLRVVG